MSSPRFEVVAPFQPAGDQPKAIRELTAGLKRGDKYQTLLGVTGSGKTMTLAHTIANYGKPTLVLSHNKTLAAQLYGELRQFLPAQRGRVLRLLLRLLPARGVRPLDRRVHREGRVDQPGHREPPAPRHLQPDGARGRGHRRHGQRHLRPGRSGGVPQAHGDGAPGRAARPGRDSLRAGADSLRPERRRLRPGHLPGPGRFDRDLPGLCRTGHPDRAVGRRGRADQQDQSADRRHDRPARPVRHLPGQALRHPASHHRAGGEGHPRGAGRCGWPS